MLCAGQAGSERKGERVAPASVTFLHQLNEVQDGLLLAGTADGAVRVWRNYALKSEQRLASAWQVSFQLRHCDAEDIQAISDCLIFIVLSGLVCHFLWSVSRHCSLLLVVQPGLL